MAEFNGHEIPIDVIAKALFAPETLILYIVSQELEKNGQINIKNFADKVFNNKPSEETLFSSLFAGKDLEQVKKEFCSSIIELYSKIPKYEYIESENLITVKN